MTRPVGNFPSGTVALPNEPTNAAGPGAAIAEATKLPAHWKGSSPEFAIKLDEALAKLEPHEQDLVRPYVETLRNPAHFGKILQKAVNDGNKTAVDFLLKQKSLFGNKIDRKSLGTMAQGPLKAGNYSMVELLASHGAKFDPWWLVKAFDKTETDIAKIKCLVRGVDLNRTEPPLLVYALSRLSKKDTECQLAVVTALLEAGADVNRRSYKRSDGHLHDKAAIDIAFEAKNLHVVVFLLDHGATLPPEFDGDGAVLLTKCADLYASAGNEKVGMLIHKALEDYLLDVLEEGDSPPIEVVRYVARYNAPELIDEQLAKLKEAGLMVAGNNLSFALTGAYSTAAHGLMVVEYARSWALDPDAPMSHVLAILDFVKNQARGAPKPVRDALLIAVKELFIELRQSELEEYRDKAWELVHNFLAKAPFRI